MTQKRRPQFNKGYRHEIMNLLMGFGVVSVKSLKLLGKDQYVMAHTIKRMEAEEYIEIIKFTNNRRTYKCLRLIDFDRKAKSYLKDFPTGYYKSYKTYAEQNARTLRRNADKADSFRKERVVRLGEIGTLCYTSLIKCMPNEKRRILERKDRLSDGLYFFTGAEIKQTTAMLINSRMQGIIISNSDIYVVYNTGNAKLRWSDQTEGQGCRLAMLAANEYREKPININDVKQAIVFGEESICLSLLTNTYTGDESQDQTNLIHLPSIFNEMLFIPTNESGKEILQSMVYPEWKKRLCDLYLSDCDNPNLRNGVPHDATKDGANVLLFCIPDIERLFSFTKQAIWRGNPSEFIVRCYSWQKPMLEKVSENSFLIETVD